MSRGRILLVDDEKILLLGLKKVFEEAGYDTEIAQSGKEAIGKVCEKTFDLIFADIVMPEISDPQVSNEVKKYLLLQK